MLPLRIAPDVTRNGRMMEQPGMAPSTGEWFLIASQGDMVARIRPGMLLGETAAGEVTFDSSCAQLELGIACDGSVVLSAVDDYELESAGGTRSRRESLARYRRAEIHLPHNVLQLDTDFADSVEPDDTVKIRVVGLTETIVESPAGRVPEVLPDDPADAAVAARPPRPTTSKAKPGGVRGTDAPPAEPTHGTPRPSPRPSPPRPPAPRPAERTVDEDTAKKSSISAGSQNRRAERTGVRRERSLVPLVAASIGLAVVIVGVALLYPVLREGRESQSPTTADAVPAPQTDPVQAPDVATDVGKESSAPDSEVVITPVRLPPLPLRLLELPTPEVTEAGTAEQVAERPSESLREPEPITALPIEPVVLPPVEQRTIAPTVEVVDSRPDPVFIAGLEGIGEAAQAMAETLAQRRDLLAADLALAQGRLTSPPEASAYTLYNRVLAQDPASSEARSGLQSVRQQLINRALAQLAGGRLDDARSSLQAAEDAGADPRLVTDLQAEIDYRQGLTNARNQ